MLKLETRPAMLGPSLNTRTEKHGEEDVPAHDITVTGIMLTAEELNSLLAPADAHAALFDTSQPMAHPRLRNLKPLALTDKFEDAQITFLLGMNRKKVALANVTVKKLRLEPQDGGLTMLTVQVQAKSEQIGKDLPLLISRLNQSIDIEVDAGEPIDDDESDESQAQLQMPHKGGSAEEAPRRKRRGPDGEDDQPATH